VPTTFAARKEPLARRRGDHRTIVDAVLARETSGHATVIIIKQCYLNSNVDNRLVTVYVKCRMSKHHILETHTEMSNQLRAVSH